MIEAAQAMRPMIRPETIKLERVEESKAMLKDLLPGTRA